ncbi:MAG: S-adenosylmethionine:tRNA ribosyltransferase-isomerase [Acidimicrobiia bacterium]|nr:S-adenosylmethionine:tRNA ribosyltransferase-isomerase [Acidimicrobiia bacterium]
MDLAVPAFEIPSDRRASRPPERRGGARDAVRLMSASSDHLEHLAFGEIGSALDPGDLVVFNNSMTLPASVVVDEDLAIHFSTRQPGGLMVVEPRRAVGHTSERLFSAPPQRIELPGQAALELLVPFPIGSQAKRLWLASMTSPLALDDYLAVWGRPIRYSHVDGPYPLELYQTVFGSFPGSAEMPSAGRPFTERTVTEMVRRGIRFAPVTLHTGVSSQESGEEPYPEWFQVSAPTAALVNHTRARGGRVVAVGTTVVRALESAADASGSVYPAKGWTELVIGPDHEMSGVDGLVTGWHEPGSTHLAMLESLVGRPLVDAVYAAALESGYLWHEFGDSLLLLPDRRFGLGLVV